MDFNRPDRDFVSALPKDVCEVFDETDIEKVWDCLSTVFKLNKKKWKEEFEKVYSKSSREYSKMELFVRFGKEHFQPALNKILFRASNHPTWLMLIRFIVQDKIKAVEQEKGRIAKMYGRDSRYKTGNVHAACRTFSR